MQPHEYSRRILVAVTGLSPQVITETLYALAKSQSPPFLPNEIHLLTTRKGAAKVHDLLLAEINSVYQSFCSDYEIKPVEKSNWHIHVLSNNGNYIDDLLTEEDHFSFANQSLNLIRTITSDPNSVLHVSMAGGRKTMGFFVAYALSLYGRVQDRLSHVLVSSEFETLPDFFYPTPYDKSCVDKFGNQYNAALAEILLTNIPFVRLRYKLTGDLLKGEMTYTEAVDVVQSKVTNDQTLYVYPKKCLIIIQNHEISLTDNQMAMYLLFVDRTLAGLPPIPGPKKDVPDKEWSFCFVESLLRVGSDSMRDRFQTERALKNGMDGNYFYTAISRVNQKIINGLGKPSAVSYLIQTDNKKPSKYSLKLLKNNIKLIE